MTQIENIRCFFNSLFIFLRSILGGALGHFYWVSSKVAELENALDSLKHRSGKLLESYKLPKWNLFIGFNKSAAKTEWNRKKGEVPKVNFFVCMAEYRSMLGQLLQYNGFCTSLQNQSLLVFCLPLFTSYCIEMVPELHYHVFLLLKQYALQFCQNTAQ